MSPKTLALAVLALSLTFAPAAAQSVKTMEATLGKDQVEQYSLGVKGLVLNEGGFKVTWVEARPAVAIISEDKDDFELEAGDVILAIDDRAIDSPGDYQDALEMCGLRGGRMRLTVRRFRTNRVQRWWTRPIRVRVPRQDPRPPIVDPPAVSAGVKVLLIADTGDKSIGKNAEVSLRSVYNTLNTTPGLRDQDVTILRGVGVTESGVLAAIDRIPVRRNETLLVYVICHGAYDKALAAGDPAGGHYLQLPGKGLQRKKLVQSMKGRGARLTVLITDCCNVFIKSGLSPLAGEVPAVGNNRLLKNLLLDHAGFIDICASRKDQFGWGNPVRGCFFSANFSKVAGEGLPGATFVDWSAFVGQVGEQTNREYQDIRTATLKNPGGMTEQNLRFMRNQTEQRPQVFENTVKRASRAP